MKLTFQKQGPGQPLKRPLEPEEGPLSQQQYLTRLHELQSASDTSLADFTKPQVASFPQGTYRLGLTTKSCFYSNVLLVYTVESSYLSGKEYPS